MSGKKCWEQNFDLLIFFWLFGPKYVEKMVFWDFLDFWAPKIEKKGTIGLKIKNLFPTFFQIWFHLTFQPIFSSNELFGWKLLIVLWHLKIQAVWSALVARQLLTRRWCGREWSVFVTIYSLLLSLHGKYVTLSSVLFMDLVRSWLDNQDASLMASFCLAHFMWGHF